MALLNMQDMIQQYALRSGILGQDGQMATPTQAAPQAGLLNSPGFAQALLNAGATMSAASQRGYGFGGAFSLGAQQFGGTLQEAKDRQALAEKEATQNQLAAIKDIIGLKTNQEELGLRMQAAALQRRAQQDALDGRQQERMAAEQRKQAIMASGDENLIRAYQFGGDDLAKEYFKNTITPKERKTITQGDVVYYADTGKPVLETTTGAAPPLKLTEGQKRAKDMADQAMGDFEIAKQKWLPDGLEGDVATGAIGPIDSLYGDGRTADQAMGRVTQNAQYMKSGASAPDAEVAKTLALYTPSALDSPQQVKNKLMSMEQYLQSNLPEGYVRKNALPAPDQAIAPNATANMPPVPQGVDPSVWQYMTPEERVLFQ